eukprot:12903031-Alexandrium_andersonii.AAC.1
MPPPPSVRPGTCVAVDITVACACPDTCVLGHIGHTVLRHAARCCFARVAYDRCVLHGWPSHDRLVRFQHAPYHCNAVHSAWHCLAALTI